jgi:uncharacterized protein (DUF4415 family)
MSKIDKALQDRIAAAKARATALIANMTDEEDAALTAAAEADPDNPPIPDDARFVTYQEARRRGRPRVPNPKRQVTLRLDGEVVDGMRALGDGWQVRVNAVLKDWLKKAS